MGTLSGGLTCEARFANTVIAIDAIFTDAIITWVTGTIIKVYLTVGACDDKEKISFKEQLQEFKTKKENILLHCLMLEHTGGFSLCLTVCFWGFFQSYLRFHVGTGRCTC